MRLLQDLFLVRDFSGKTKMLQSARKRKIQVQTCLQPYAMLSFQKISLCNALYLPYPMLAQRRSSEHNIPLPLRPPEPLQPSRLDPGISIQIPNPQRLALATPLLLLFLLAIVLIQLKHCLADLR